MKHRPKDNFVSNHPIDYFQKSFFNNYNYNFWIHKANALMNYIQNPEKIKELKFDEDKDAEEYIIENLKMELHMMKFHSSESLMLAIFSAIYQPELPWVWLSRCKLQTQISLIQKLSTHGLYALVEHPEEWLRVNLYPSIHEKHENYERSVKSTIFVINYLQTIAKDYLDHIEYNFYKHGLRCFPGQGTIQVIGEQTGEKIDFKGGNILQLLEFQEERHQSQTKIRIKSSTKWYDIEQDLRIIKINSAVLLNLFEKRKTDLNASLGNPKNFGYYLFHDMKIEDIFKSDVELRKFSF